MAKLRKEKFEQDTLIFFLSDNGGPTRELTSSNKPLRDSKGSMYEGGLRVPFMMQWPSRLAKGGTYRQPVISLDIFGTAAAVAGGAPKNWKRKLNGVNLIPHLTGEKNTAPHDTLFWRQESRAGLRKGDWKILKNPRRGQGTEWQLYNLANDISETTDLSKQKLAKRAELLADWNKLNARMVEPFWKRPR